MTQRKVVMITGASRGIGAATARKFAINGFDIVLCYNKSQDEAFMLQRELESKYGVRVLVLQGDLSVSKNCKDITSKAIKMFGKIDVLVNNAGISFTNLLIDTTDEDIDYVLSTNLSSVIYMTREVIKSMISPGVGKIVNVSSMWGVSGASTESIYSASKAGIIGFTKAMAKEVGLMNINVNAVAPGVIMTDMCKHLSEETLEDLKNSSSLGKLGRTEYVADAIYFLASSEADFITGQVLGVDGGFLQ